MSESKDLDVSSNLPPHHPMTRKGLINGFAIRSFRDVADEDYVAARLAFRARLPHVALWQTQQAIEKYLKCILLLNRIPATKVLHSLTASLKLVEDSGKITLDIKPISLEFLQKIDQIGAFRYFEVSMVWDFRELFKLDRLVWELRRYCTLDKSHSAHILEQGVVPPRYSLAGGLLEEIVKSKEHPSHKVLLWNNIFWGDRRRRVVRFKGYLAFKNAPLHMHPEIMDELLSLVYLPKHLVAARRRHKAPGYEVPPDA